MPTLVLLAGPNGAGKTPFNDRFLRRRVLERLDALSDARAQIKRGVRWLRRRPEWRRRARISGPGAGWGR